MTQKLVKGAPAWPIPTLRAGKGGMSMSNTTSFTKLSVGGEVPDTPDVEAGNQHASRGNEVNHPDLGFDQMCLAKVAAFEDWWYLQ